MSAWGTTGRVTMEGEARPGAVRWAYIDGALVGWVGYPERYPEQQDSDWWATAYKHAKRPGYFGKTEDLPSLDAAVMWVLRRAAPDVWRQERGPVPVVWRSRSFAPGKWSTELRGGLVLVSDSHAEALAAALAATPPPPKRAGRVTIPKRTEVE